MWWFHPLRMRAGPQHQQDSLSRGKQPSLLAPPWLPYHSCHCYREPQSALDSDPRGLRKAQPVRTLIRPVIPASPTQSFLFLSIPFCSNPARSHLNSCSTTFTSELACAFTPFSSLISRFRSRSTIALCCLSFHPVPVAKTRSSSLPKNSELSKAGAHDTNAVCLFARHSTSRHWKGIGGAWNRRDFELVVDDKLLRSQTTIHDAAFCTDSGFGGVGGGGSCSSHCKAMEERRGFLPGTDQNDKRHEWKGGRSKGKIFS
jgi:hypothetical protein